jgi:hypothetical protein
MRLVILSIAMLAVACGGQVDNGSEPDASTDAPVKPDAPTAETIITPGCCELGAPSCGCTVVGTLPGGICSTMCDARPIGWTRSVDERGCPKWNVPAGSCAPSRCPGTATFCSSGCAAVQGQRYQAGIGCVEPPATAGCMDPTGGCTGAITCKVRISDGALFRFNAGCPLEGWRACTDTESMQVMSAPSCDTVVFDAG